MSRRALELGAERGEDGWLTPIGQNRYVWRVGARGRIRIPNIFRARENVTRCIAAGPKKSGIGYVLSELDDFAVA